MDRIIGIDLGTSTCEISCIVDGSPVIIPNSLGKPVTPSVVHIGEDGEILVGEPAAEYLLTRPECTFMEVKRLTGSGEKLTAHGRAYLPEEIQSLLIKYLIGCAEDYLKEPVTRAVITVPAYFNDTQRRATAKAGELAGLTVERIINEPTAAALDYGLQNLRECKNILVFDFGGGTLDITVLEMFEGVLEVMASCGNNHLGGKDFDELIMQNLADVKNDARAQMRLKKAAEECKIALSTKQQHEISLPFLWTGKKGKPMSVERTVSREEFEEWIKEKVTMAHEPMMTALKDAKLNPEDLDSVLMVGGTTRIPVVGRMVSEALGIKPKSLVDPELTVARGAAIQAGILEDTFSVDRQLVLTDVCPLTLGVAVRDTDDFFGDSMKFSPIIPRNTTVPVERSEMYWPSEDYQTTVLIKVYQGEASDPEENTYLGELRLSDLPYAKKLNNPLEVTFAYDINGILQVKAHALSNNKSVETVLNTAGVQHKEPESKKLDLTKWQQAPNVKQYRPLIRKAERLVASNCVFKEQLEEFTDYLKEALLLEDALSAEDYRREIQDLIEQIKDWS